jgi:NTP pyrophosphatase (non-canonical NTP hydrolase)
VNRDQWDRIDLYLPERDPDAVVEREELWHELILSLADVTEQAVFEHRYKRNKAHFVSLADACDQLIGAAFDMLLHGFYNTKEQVRELITAENQRTALRHGPPEERTESLLTLLLVLTEEVGEVAEAVQIDKSWRTWKVSEELVQVASVACTIRSIARARSGVNA